MRKNTSLEFTEQELIESLGENRPETIGLLYDKYAGVLLGLISRMMRDHEAAEAVLQDTFVTIWQQKETFDASRLKLLSWMILIARDTAMAALKSGTYTSSSERIEFPSSEGLINSQGSTELKVTEHFCQLEPLEKAVLDLIYIKGYSCPEAATALKISEETLKITLKLACKQLRAGKTI